MSTHWLPHVHLPKLLAFFNYRCVSYLAASVLFLSGALKIHELATIPVSDNFYDSKWALLTWAQVELVLAAWVICGFYPRPTRIGLTMLFAVLGSFSLFSIWQGDTTCGCFGRLPLSPRVSFLIDCAFFLILSWIPVPEWHLATFRSNPTRLTALLFGAALLTIGSATLVLSYKPSEVLPSGEVVLNQGAIVVKPEDWIGKPCPLLSHIDVGDRLAQGNWLAVLYRDDCPACEAALMAYEDLSRNGRLPAETRLACIQVQQSQAGGVHALLNDAVWLRGQLGQLTRPWYLSTPTIVELKDGNCTGVLKEPTAYTRAAANSSANGRMLNAEIPFASAQELADFFERGVANPAPAGLPDYVQGRKQKLLERSGCGLASVVAVAQYYHLPLSTADYEKIFDLLKRGRGTSLLELSDLARSFGLYAMGAELSIEQLERIHKPAVVSILDTSFAVIFDFMEEGPNLVRPMQSPVWLKYSEFEKAFGNPGRALILSTEPLRADALGLAVAPRKKSAGEKLGRILKLSPSNLELGNIASSFWAGKVTIENLGTESLRIKDLRPNCNCIVAKADATLIPPGKHTILNISGQQLRPGCFQYRLALSTNYSAEPVLIYINGCLDGLISVNRPAMVLPNVLAEHTQDYSVPIDLNPGIGPDQVLATVKPEGPISCRVLRSSKGTELQIHFAGLSEPGWYRYVIELSPKGTPGALSAALLLAVRVVPRLDVFPLSVFISDAELAGLWTRRLTIKGAPELDNLALIWSDPAFASAIRQRVSKTGPGQWLITLGPEVTGAARKLGGCSALLRIERDKQVLETIHFRLGNAARFRPIGFGQANN
jgi:hypothetical protein